VFPGTVIRKLAPSEEPFARYHAFTRFTAHLRGDIDVAAMSEAFDALLEAHPVFANHLEQGPDGNHQIVASDLLHSGISVVDAKHGVRTEDAHMKLDQRASLFNLQVTLGEGETHVTAYVHHSLADAHHIAGLLDELLSRYTDVVSTGDPGPVIPEAAPVPAEVVLQQRGIKQHGVSGFERFAPLLFAYDLPTNPELTYAEDFWSPQPIPVTRCRLTKQETADLLEFSRDHGISLNAAIAAAILLAEWQLRDTPHVPIPYCYAVDLRFLLTPPLTATESTNAVGLASYVAEIGPDTDIIDLANDIVETFRADLSDGLIHQSVLNTRIFDGTPPGLPPIVFTTNVSTLPVVRTPAGVELEALYSQLYCAMHVPIGFYACISAADRLTIEHHGDIPAPEKSLEVIRSLLCSIPSEYGWVME
jgi:hypothetical protein